MTDSSEYLKCLDINDFNTVYVSCESIRSDWEDLATYLGVDRSSVNAIKADGKGVSDCLRQAIDAWLRQQFPVPQSTKPSWRSLCYAVSRIDGSLSESIQKDHPCVCGLCTTAPLNVVETVPNGDQALADFKNKLITVASCIETNDVRSSASELKAAFNMLIEIVHEDIASVSVSKLRLRVSRHFQDEEEKVNDEIEKHLTKIEFYTTSEAILNYFVRHNFIGYINYSLIKVFQGMSQNVLLKNCMEDYEEVYLGFLKFSFTKLEDVFQQCPDLRPDYPAGIPKFSLRLESKWDGKSVIDLKEFLKQCFSNSGCIDQLMIADVSRNCIIIAFAVLPHITRTVLQYLTNDEVISTLKEEGISVNVSQIYSESTNQNLPASQLTEGLKGDLEMLSMSGDTGISVASDSTSQISLRDIDHLSSDPLDGDSDIFMERFEEYEYALYVMQMKRKRLERQVQVAQKNEERINRKIVKITKLARFTGMSEDKIKKGRNLIEAAKSGNVENVKSLLELGVNINTKERLGPWTGDMDTVGSTQTIDIMFSRGATHKTPLHYASEYGHVKVVSTLLSSQAIVDLVDQDGATPLHYASTNGHSEVVTVLLSYKASTNVVDKDQKTPLQCAAEMGHTVIVNMLLSQTDVSAITESLLPAAENGHSEVVNILLSHTEALIAIDDSDMQTGMTPLQAASERGHVEVVNILISHGAYLNYDDLHNDVKPPLHLAAENGHSHVVEALIEHGSKPQAVDKDGNTALHCASWNDYYDVVSLLLTRCPVNVNALTNHPDCQSPLHLAIMKGHTNIAELLVSNGADIYVEDEHKQSPVLLAVVLNYEKFLSSQRISEDTIMKYRLPPGWTAQMGNMFHRLEYTNTLTGQSITTHPLLLGEEDKDTVY